MTTITREELQRHQKIAEQSLKKFSAACKVIDGLLKNHNGVLPTVAEDNPAERKRYIAEMDEIVFEATNALYGAVHSLHSNINAHRLPIPANENPYRLACRAARVELQRILFIYPKVNISLGHFHDNLWEVHDQFRFKPTLHNLTLKDVAVPSTRMQLAAVKAELTAKTAKAAAAKKAAKKAARPGAGRQRDQSSGFGHSPCAPQ